MDITRKIVSVYLKIRKWARWHTPVIPVLKILRPEGGEFKVSVGYLVKYYFKGKKNQTTRDMI